MRGVPNGSTSEVSSITDHRRTVDQSSGAAPNWSITKVASSGAIVLRFFGPTRTWEIAEFLAALTEMMPEKNANIIFDLRELHGHNPETKEPVKKWLIEHKRRISRVTVVVAKHATIIKIVSSVIGLASGIKIVIRDDLDGVSPPTNLQQVEKTD